MIPSALFSRLAALMVLAMALASCGTSAPVGAGTGTQYLDAFAPNMVPTFSQEMMDTVSYWDGNNLAGSPRVVLDLSEQKAYFYKGETLAGVSMICSGDDAHPTVPGSFKIAEKDRNHRSNLYGDFVDGAGNVVKANVDATKDRPLPGTTFLGSDMTHFMRFNKGAGMHKGYMAGYPASHGCVRMPAHMAEIFYNNVTVGTPVLVRP
jgi:L,D-transpeptidase catalytic domain